MVKLEGHAVDLFAEPGRLDRGVDLLGYGDVRVPEELARSERRSTGLEQGGRRTPKVMEADLPDDWNRPEQRAVHRAERPIRRGRPLPVSATAGSTSSQRLLAHPTQRAGPVLPAGPLLRPFLNEFG